MNYLVVHPSLLHPAITLINELLLRSQTLSLFSVAMLFVV